MNEGAATFTTAPPAGGRADPGRLGRAQPVGALTDRRIALLIAAAAAMVRLGVIWSSGGLKVLNGYDDGVYFTAANALVHGRLPYRDFVLLHPPGIAVLGSGPVWLGHALGLTDSSTLGMMRLLFVAIGCLNAVLAFRAGSHLSRTAGVVAGSLYAVWSPVIREERTMLLEAIVLLGTLTALALIPAISNRPVPGRWRPLVAGSVAGLAVATKLWAVVPLLVILGSLLVVGRWRRAAAYGGSAVAVAAAICVPFLLASHGRMWQQVITAQADRPAVPGGRPARIPGMLDLTAWPFSLGAAPSVPTRPVDPTAAVALFVASHRAVSFTMIVVAAVLVVAVVVAVRLPVARTWVALTVVQSAVLLAVPVFFDGYASFVAPGLVLVAGAAGHLLWTLRPEPLPRRILGSAGALALAATAWGAVMTDNGVAFAPSVGSLVASARCVASDSPTALVLADRLSANLAHDCPVVADFSGVVYLYPATHHGPMTNDEQRVISSAYQQFTLDYFGQADAVILRYRTATGLDAATIAALARRPLLRARSPRVFGAAEPTPAETSP